MVDFVESHFDRDKLTEFILEIRYKPCPIVLDKRGEWAKELLQKTGLSHWIITQNRIDVHNHTDNPEKATERCFVGFRNAGWVVREDSNHNHFLEKCNQLINFWFSKEELFSDKQPSINRIGVKFKYGDEYFLPFQSLLDKYKEKYLNPNDCVKSIYDAEISDIGGYLVLNDKDIKIQSMSGPMGSDQIKNERYFPYIEAPPKTILYFEIDSSVSPNKNIHYKNISNTVEKLIRKNFASHSRLLQEMD